MIEVRSPVDGRLLRLRREDEGPVAPGTPLFEVGDPRALEIVADVLSTDAVALRPGMRATISDWGGPELAAHVRTVEPAAYTKVSPLGVEEQRVDVVLELDGPAAPALGDAFSAQARFILSEAVDALRVPVGAVFRTADGWAAYGVRDGKARRTPVTLGRTDGSFYEVLSGLDEGSTVIVHPGERVGDRTRVAPR